MYLITDSYGTRQRAWTYRSALAWLACCSPDARIRCAVSYRTLARRIVAA